MVDPRVYIAAPYPLRDEAIALMQFLERSGFGVTSRWLTQPGALTEAFALMDLADVAAADALVAMNPIAWHESGSGGRHVEFGYALALGKPIVLWGRPSNVFHYAIASAVTVVEDRAGIVAALRVLTGHATP